MAKINYIREERAFLALADRTRLGEHERLLWWALFIEFNDRQQGSEWSEDFVAIPNELLLAHLPYSVETLRRARLGLQEAGIIDVKAEAKRGSIPRYQLHYLSLTESAAPRVRPAIAPPIAPPESAETEEQTAIAPPIAPPKSPQIVEQSAVSSYSNNHKQKQKDTICVSIYPSIQSPVREKKDGWMETQERVSQMEQVVREQIDARCYQGSGDEALVNEIVWCIMEVYLTEGEGFRAGGVPIPPDMVLRNFHAFNETHMDGLLWRMKNKPEKVSNMRNYLRSAIYNAPMYDAHEKQNEFMHLWSRPLSRTG